MADGVTALAQLYALRSFNQWQYALYPNFIIIFVRAHKRTWIYQCLSHEKSCYYLLVMYTWKIYSHRKCTNWQQINLTVLTKWSECHQNLSFGWILTQECNFVSVYHIKTSKLLFVMVSYCVYQSPQPTLCKSDWFLMWSSVSESSLHLFLSYYFILHKW